MTGRHDDIHALEFHQHRQRGKRHDRLCVVPARMVTNVHRRMAESQSGRCVPKFSKDLSAVKRGRNLKMQGGQTADVNRLA